MKLLLLRYACLVVLLGAGMVASARAQAPATVQEIRIEHVGPASVSDALIRSNIRIREGDSFNQLNVDQDVRNLYATGYFYNIRVTRDEADDGVVLTYTVQSKPVLTDIRIEGNEKFSDNRLRKKIEDAVGSMSEVGEPLNEQRLFEEARAIREYYQKKGYHGTKVDYSLSIDESTGKGSVVFEIEESPKVKIVDVEFLGAEAFGQRKLRKVLKTRRWWIFSWLTGSGKLKDEQFQEDQEKLRDFYRNEGYIDFEIRDVEMDYTTPERLVIRFVLFEGKQYKVGSVDIEGNEIVAEEEIEKALPMKEEDVFTPNGLSDNREAIEDTYGERGYIDTRIATRKQANTETGTMDLDYLLEEGEQSYIEKIQIRGNTKTKDKVIRRELLVNPGETFDMVRVKRSKRRLQNMNFFEKVDTRAEPTDIPNRRDLVVSVEEKNTGNFTMGAGFSSVDELVGFVELTQGNFDLFNPPYFTGDGQKFRIRAQFGTARQDYIMSFIEPWFLGRKLALSVDLYHRDLDFNSTEYEETRTGGRVGLTRALWRDYLRGTVSYTLESVDLEFDHNANYTEQLLRQQEGQRLVSKAGFGLAYDTRAGGDYLFPNHGTLTELENEVAGGPFGGDTDYYKVELKSNWYFPGFFQGHTFRITTRTGVMDRFDGSEVTPLFDRFYLGGAYSLRGYRWREVGPRDYDFSEDDPRPIDEPRGGHTYWFASAEYTIPVIENLRFAIFYDIGNVYEDPYSFEPQDPPDRFGRHTRFYSDDVGVGIRLNLPIGPLKLDYAFPLTDGDGEGRDSGRFNFGITTREF